MVIIFCLFLITLNKSCSNSLDLDNFDDLRYFEHSKFSSRIILIANNLALILTYSAQVDFSKDHEHALVAMSSIEAIEYTKVPK